ncbi:MAG TPA: hypothetical protein VFH80_12290 [Solirubrobacteraceae bacterium]|nr:hypothetical protein [Solirubrobacteraceae bacterium]
MPVLALVLVVLALASGAGAILVALHRRRTPRELRGDWWTPFEREFRDYARPAAPRRRRHRGGRA